jgi:hypothetical protein
MQVQKQVRKQRLLLFAKKSFTICDPTLQKKLANDRPVMVFQINLSNRTGYDAICGNFFPCLVRKMTGVENPYEGSISRHT